MKKKTFQNVWTIEQVVTQHVKVVFSSAVSEEDAMNLYLEDLEEDVIDTQELDVEVIGVVN